MSADNIIAFAAVFALIVSMAAAFYAARSASAAEKSADVAATAQSRSARLELVGKCHEVLAEKFQIELLGMSLKFEYTSLYEFTNSSVEQLRRNLDEHLVMAAEEVIEAMALADDPTKLFLVSCADLENMSARIGITRVKLRAIHNSLVRQLTETQTYRNNIQNNNVAIRSSRNAE